MTKKRGDKTATGDSAKRTRSARERKKVELWIEQAEERLQIEREMAAYESWPIRVRRKRIRTKNRRRR
jgi:hypothetical protein